jgi:hypothetical protein
MRTVLIGAILAIACGIARAGEITIDKDDFTGDVTRTYMEITKLTAHEGLTSPQVILQLIQDTNGTLGALLTVGYRAKDRNGFSGRLLSRTGNEFSFVHLQTKVITCAGNPGFAFMEVFLLEGVDEAQMRALADPTTEYKLYGPRDIQFTVSGERLEEWLELLAAD